METMKKDEIVLFESGDHKVALNVTVENETVWLTRNQLADLFDRDVKTIGKHIKSALEEEVDLSTVANFEIVQNEGGREVRRNVEHYNLEMITSIGYRVKSKRGVEFRRWANSVLKKYILDGYAINDRRLQALEKTVEIQTKMLANSLDVEQQDVLKAVNQYTKALTLLDQYDHQSLEKPEGDTPIYRITYEDCRSMIDQMEDTFKSDVFGLEKEKGKFDKYWANGILTIPEIAGKNVI